jgi:branched-chain amino acid aminotransferase
MIQLDFENGQWGDLEVVEQKEIEVHPSAMSVQFGSSVFEGYKVYRVEDKFINLFRIKDNYKRLKNTCARLCVPCPSYELYFNALDMLLDTSSIWSEPIDSEWLYLRPIILGLDSHIMPIISNRFKFILLAAPIRPYQGDSLNLWIEEKYSRAAQGGLGYAKTAANYAHQFLPMNIAKKNNCDSVLWLDASTHSVIEEGSTMNVFFKIGDGFYTPKLTDSILPGITRDSVINILKEKKQPVIEKAISIQDVLHAIKTGELHETFVTSTALGICSVDSIVYKGERYKASFTNKNSGEIRDNINEIYSGRYHKFSDWIHSKKIVGR